MRKVTQIHVISAKNIIDRAKAFPYNAALFTVIFRELARIAQLVEQRIENPCVPGSNPGSGTIYFISHCFYLNIIKYIPSVPKTVPKLNLKSLSIVALI